MVAFNPDVEGKSNKEAVAYFKEEKQKLAKMDSVYQAALRNIAAYLEKR